LELVEVKNGTARVLESRKTSGKLPVMLGVEWRDGIVTAQAGRDELSTVAQVGAGRVGVWADGTSKTVALKEFRALGAPQPWGEAPLPDKISKDYLMDEWASNAKAWREAKDGVRWHTGDFFRDIVLSLPMRSLNEGGKVTAWLGANPDKPNTGAQLLVSRDGSNWRLALSEEGRELKTTTVPIPAKDASLRAVRQPLGGG
jgi:hypothetical protein